jgi:hypothetical protein
MKLLNRSFVSVRLIRSTAAEVLLKRLNASDAADGSAIIATPQGSQVDLIGAKDVQDAQRLAQRLAEAFGKYQTKVLADSVAPVLGNRDANANAVLESLVLVKTLQLSEADKAIVELLNHKKLTDAVRSAAYGTLAALSTERAVSGLLDAALKDVKALDALRLCMPAGATALVPALKLGDRERLVLAYDAVIAICSIDQAKPAEFWQTGDKKPQQAEIDRVKERVSICVKARPE